MRALLPVFAVIFGVLGFAEPAAACGACFDMGLQAAWWGAPALGILAGLLLAEVIISALVWRAMGHTPRVRRGRSTAFAVVLGLAASMLIGGSGLALGIGMLLVLVPTFVRSLAREMPATPRAGLLRVLGVALPLVACSVGLLPSQRETASLVQLAVSVRARPAGDSWIHEELRGRKDADPELDARLLSDARHGEALRLMRLHAQLSSPAHHTELCARLLAQTPEEQRERLAAACPAP